MILADHQSTDQKEQISLKGDIGLDNIHELQSFLMSVSASKMDYMIDIQQAKLVDLSTVQVLVSFQNKIRQENKNANVSFIFGSAWGDLLQASGFTRLWFDVDNNEKTQN